MYGKHQNYDWKNRLITSLGVAGHPARRATYALPACMDSRYLIRLSSAHIAAIDIGFDLMKDRTPNGHFAGAVRSEHVVARDNAADAIHREVAPVIPGDNRQVRHGRLQRRGSWAVSLRVPAVAGSAVGAKKSAPCVERMSVGNCSSAEARISGTGIERAGREDGRRSTPRRLSESHSGEPADLPSAISS